jgi:hypothetical protein
MAYLVEESGGVCASCGETERLAFHHLTLGDNNFTICEETDRPIEELMAEVKDCLLLCYHCHFSHHAGLDYGVGHRIVNKRSAYKDARNVAFAELMQREREKRVGKSIIRDWEKDRLTRIKELRPMANNKQYSKKRTKARRELAELLS